MSNSLQKKPGVGISVYATSIKLSMGEGAGIYYLNLALLPCGASYFLSSLMTSDFMADPSHKLLFFYDVSSRSFIVSTLIFRIRLNCSGNMVSTFYGIIYSL